MSDKDLYVVIAEMLRKQDQQSEILERIDSTLNEFMELSLKQFEQQLKFNENFLSTQDKMGHLLERITERLITDGAEVKDRLSKIEEKLS